MQHTNNKNYSLEFFDRCRSSWQWAYWWEQQLSLTCSSRRPFYKETVSIQAEPFQYVDRPVGLNQKERRRATGMCPTAWLPLKKQRQSIDSFAFFFVLFTLNVFLYTSRGKFASYCLGNYYTGISTPEGLVQCRNLLDKQIILN